MVSQGSHLSSKTLLQACDGPAFEVFRPVGTSPVVLVCEHASNRSPQTLGNLGLTDEQLQSHVAWDPGAFELAHALSSYLNATLIAARFSRLVYDCNRPPEASGAMPANTEVCSVPANAQVSVAERLARTVEIYMPFHAELSGLIAAKRARGITPVIVTVHSFTPIFCGERRDVEIGFLHAKDRRLAEEMKSIARSKSTYDIRSNQPYGPGDGVLHTIEKHLDDSPVPHVMIEVRNDLLIDTARQSDVSRLLSHSLSEAVSSLDPTQHSIIVGSS